MQKHTAKKNDAIDENKKCQPAAVQALRRKYQEQRLAKQKVTNVAKLAQKGMNYLNSSMKSVFFAATDGSNP